MAEPVSVVFSSLGQRAQPPTIARLMTAALENPSLLSLAAGFTDTHSMPGDAVREIAGELLARGGAKLDTLQYGTNQGRPALRQLLAERLRQLDGVSAGPTADDVIVTNGSQQALYLAMQVLADPGDIVLVDQPSYFVFLEMLSGLGIRARQLPVDDRGGLDLAATGAMLRQIEAAGERSRVKAVYFVSYFSNPSSRSLSRQDKMGLAGLLNSAGWRIPVLEDAAYRELYFDSPHDCPGVFALPEWAPFPKFYLGTLTKPFATGLKVGYGVCSDHLWLQKMLSVKGHHDFGTSHFGQAILEKALSAGAYDAQLARVRAIYRTKRDVLDRALRSHGLDRAGWAWAVPNGGLYLWLRGPEGVDTRIDGAFYKACVEAGVLYVPGSLCYGEPGGERCIRLSFGVLSEDGLREAARRFCLVASQQ